MDYYYLSCNFERLFPDCAERVRAYMEERFHMPTRGCCHVERTKIEPGERMITNCQSCTKVLEEAIDKYTEANGNADMEEISIIEVLAADEQFPWPDLHGERITVQDCFRAKDNKELLDAVRVCLKKMNAVPVELENNREKADFDGLWLYRNASPAFKKNASRYYEEVVSKVVHPLPEEEAVEELKKHIAQYTTERAVAYCNTCVTGINKAGGTGVHLLELMFPQKSE